MHIFFKIRGHLFKKILAAAASTVYKNDLKEIKRHTLYQNY